MARAKKTVETTETTQEEKPVYKDENIPDYDLYSIYQEHFRQQQEFFEDQQAKVLEYWTSVLNNVFWWTKK